MNYKKEVWTTLLCIVQTGIILWRAVVYVKIHDVHVPFDPASQPLKNLLPNTHEVIYVESFSSL